MLFNGNYSNIRERIRTPRMLFTLIFVTFLIGFANIGSPIEIVLQAFHNKMRAQPVSGDIAVVGIDDRAVSVHGAWPWERSILSEMTQRLFDEGANRVFFHMVLQDGAPEADKAFAETIGKYPNRVFVAGNKDFVTDPEFGRDVLPMKALKGKAETVSVMRFFEFWNGIKSLDYANVLDDKPVPSIEAALSGVHGEVNERFPIDYSYQTSSIPYVSAVDVLSDEGVIKPLSGKDVLVGFNSRRLAPHYMLIGQPQNSEVFISAIGAETLLHGRPVSLGWLPAWLIACAAVIYILPSRTFRRRLSVGTLTLTVFLIAPIPLAHLNVFIQVAPALLLTGMATLYATWHRFGASQKNSGSINPISGLQTINSIRHDDRQDPRPLISARIRRYTEVVSALPPNSEQKLVQEILARVKLGAGDAELLHGDDGNFFWLPSITDQTILTEQFQALNVIFRTPIRVLDNTFDVDISFGVDQEYDLRLSHRIANAMAAAHSAEDSSICWKRHDPQALSEKAWSLSLLGELDEALDKGHIWVAYQPKQDLKTKEIVGAEALVRWTHPIRGPIGPDEFIAMAERHNRIDKLTTFVLNDALRVAREVQNTNPDFSISVNISPGLLTSLEILNTVKTALARHDVAPDKLILEVTETMAIIHSETPTLLMNEFRAMGIGLSIDDYGTGLSTLEYLKKIPATELKIDRSFTKDICTSQHDQTVMRSTIQLSHALGMKAVVEGIETIEVLCLLADMGSDLGQGYYIARPLPADDLILMTQKNHIAKQA